VSVPCSSCSSRCLARAPERMTHSPVHGPRKLIDVAEADALWDAMKTDGTGRSAPPGAVIDAAAYVRAKTAWMEARAQREALELRVRQGALLDRGRVEREQEAFAQRVRDGWLRWPARVAPALASQWRLDQVDVVAALEQVVMTHLEELADVVARLDA
jgi:hypothetical protein